jgi:hypothetical protein
MNKEEIKEYLKRVEELELKLTGEDKDTVQWLIYGYNECARLLNQLETNIDELKKWLEEEKDRLVRECSNIYEDSLGKTKLVSEDIFNELTKVSEKIVELERGKEFRR